MTLVHLRHLVALARCGSFSKAAQALFLTQPALSRSIKALQDELGLPLFDRVGRRAELTPFGRTTLARAEQLLTDAEQLQACGQRPLEGAGAALRIGLGSGPGAMLMTPLLRQTARERPRLRLEVARGGTALLLQALRERRLDALVLDARSLPPAPDLRTDAVHEMRGAFLVRPGHPLTRRDAGAGALGFADLAGYPLASTPLSDEVARVLVERYGPQAHPAECVTLSCEELHSRGGPRQRRRAAGHPRGGARLRRAGPEAPVGRPRTLRAGHAGPPRRGARPRSGAHADGRAPAGRRPAGRQPTTIARKSLTLV